MRKLIRSVAAAGFSSGETKRLVHCLRTKPELTAARQGYWERLLMDPAPPQADGGSVSSALPRGGQCTDKSLKNCPQRPHPALSLTVLKAEVAHEISFCLGNTCFLQWIICKLLGKQDRDAWKW